MRAPFQQQRVNPVEVHPDGVLVAGPAAGAAFAAGAQPVLHAGGHRRRQDREPRLHQGREGGDPVVVQQPGELEDLGGPGDAQVPGAQGGWQRGPGDHVPGLMAGQDDGQRPAGLDNDPRVPAAGPGERGGDVPGLQQGRAGNGRCDPVGARGPGFGVIQRRPGLLQAWWVNRHEPTAVTAPPPVVFLTLAVLFLSPADRILAIDRRDHHVDRVHREAQVHQPGTTPTARCPS